METVTGPTLLGTGVMADATLIASLKHTTPATR